MLAGVGVRLARLSLTCVGSFETRSARSRDRSGRPGDPYGRGDDVPPTFTTAADAIVWCEDWLIERHGGRHPAEDSYRFRGEVYLVADGPNPIAMHADGSVELYELTRNELIRSKIADRKVHAAAPIVLTGTVFESAFGR